MSGAHGRLRWLLQEGWMSVPAKYYWYVRSPTTCTRYGGAWRAQYYRCPEACGGAFCRTGVQRRRQYCRHKCRRLQYCLCQGGCGALFQQAYRVWFWYRSLTCALPSLFAPGPFRAGVPGRMAPVGPGRASRRRAVSRLPTGSPVEDAGSE